MGLERKALTLRQAQGDHFSAALEPGTRLRCATPGKPESTNSELETQNPSTLRIGIHIGDVVFERGNVFCDGVC